MLNHIKIINNKNSNLMLKYKKSKIKVMKKEKIEK